MKRRGWVIGAAGLLVGLLVGGWLLRDRSPAVSPVSATMGTDARSGGSPGLAKATREKILRDAPEARLADDLNLPGGTIQSDLAMVGSMIAAYRSIYNRKGNPIGDNREITDTLLGRNPNGNIFLQVGHRAINARGELCDRWGTPFHFHAETGTRMEVRSAGPDRKMWTVDDVFVVP